MAKLNLALVLFIVLISALSASANVLVDEYITRGVVFGGDGTCGRMTGHLDEWCDSCNGVGFSCSGPGGCDSGKKTCYLWQPGGVGNAKVLIDTKVYLVSAVVGKLSVLTKFYGGGTYEREQVDVYVNGVYVGTTSDHACNVGQDCASASWCSSSCEVEGPFTDTFDNVQFKGGENTLSFYAVDGGGSVSVYKYMIEESGPLCGDAATFSDTIPAIFRPGEKKSVKISVVNSGSSRWYHGDAYKMLERDGPFVFLVTSPVSVSGADYGHLPYGVYTGGDVTWTMDMTAPSTPGVYNVKWCMMHRGYWDFLNDAGNVCNTKPLEDNDFTCFEKTVTVSSNCGDSQIDVGEECDAGSNNGVLCNPPYGGSCTYCSSSCKLVNRPGPFCGDSFINGPESCELPNTFDNSNCGQSASSCLGTKTGVRDAFGNCNSACGCAADIFTYSCVKGSCGATCSVNSDCADKCVGSVKYSAGSCNADGCSCTYSTEECSLKNGYYDTGKTQWLSSGTCADKEQKEQEYRSYTCSGNGCTYTVTSIKWVDTGATKNKPDGTVCSVESGACEANDVCQAGSCVEKYVPENTLCRAGVGVCDSPEYCSGTSPLCPVDTFKPSTFSCRGVAGVCDNEEFCTGSSATCSTDLFKGSEIVCRGSVDQCDAEEKCSGSSANCGADLKKPDGTTCDDGLFCKENDKCASGVCGGSVKDCSGNSYSEIANCNNVPDSQKFTWDFSAAFTSVCDEVNDKCTSKDRTYSHTCSKSSCNAECEVDSDCNDNNQYSTDTCLANCSCYHTYSPSCGDGAVQNGESCELPNTIDNNYCDQTTALCGGKKLGVRDAFGNCNNQCGCSQDSFVFSCVKGSCGAECSVNSDCADKCVGNVRYYSGSCGDACGCSYSSSEDCDSKDGWYTTSETSWGWYDECREVKKIKKEYRDYSCAPGDCTFVVTNTSWEYTQEYRNLADGTSCFDGLYCTVGDYCSAGKCIRTPRDCSNNSYSDLSTCNNNPDAISYTLDFSAGFTSVCDEVNDRCTSKDRAFTHTCSKSSCNAQCESNLDCNDNNQNTIDICLSNCTCKHESNGYCGDGAVQPGESCELPNTLDNNNCAQLTSSCSGNLTGTRDAFGNCNSQCGCAADAFTYSCVKGSCGAECALNSDCINKCVGNTRYYTGVCGVSCGCGFTTENCDSKDGWYNTNQTAWNSAGPCIEKKQLKKEYRDYVCAPNNCTYTVTNYSFIDLNESRNKPDNTTCDDGLYCTQSDKCTLGKCGGSARDCSGNSYSEIAKCDNIPDAKSFTWDFSAGFTSVCDEVNDRCTSKDRAFTHTCDKNCGATCSVNSDCDDGNSSTMDKCDANSCGCTHVPIGLCGNGKIDAGEECEVSGNYAGWGPFGFQYTCEDDNTYDKCNAECKYEHVNECKYYCSADFACEGAVPNSSLSSCTMTGFNYLRDSCDANCHLKDTTCEDDYAGCTGQKECDGFLPNTNRCNYMCEYKPLYPICGDGIVDFGEECDGNSQACTNGVQSCNVNCTWGTCNALPYCGDGTCNNGEFCSSCSTDCGVCASSSSGGGHRGGGGGGSSASSSWTCGNWTTCINSFEQRTCKSGSSERIEKRNCTNVVVPQVSTSTSSVSFTVTSSSDDTKEDVPPVAKEENVQADVPVTEDKVRVVNDFAGVTGRAVVDPVKGQASWLFWLLGLLIVIVGLYYLRK